MLMPQHKTKKEEGAGDGGDIAKRVENTSRRPLFNIVSPDSDHFWRVM